MTGRGNNISEENCGMEGIDIEDGRRAEYKEKQMRGEDMWWRRNRMSSCRDDFTFEIFLNLPNAIFILCMSFISY